MTEATHGLPHLPPGAARLGSVFARPKAVAIGCVLLLVVLGWIFLGLAVAGMAERGFAGLGPGMGLFDLIVSSGPVDGIGRALAEALCRPSFGQGAFGALEFSLVFAMWCAMALAMMLPSAGPMILTYAEIADTAAAKGQHVVSPLVLAGGYLAVWIGFAAAAALLQGALTRLSLLDPAMASASGLFSGAVFILAGLYQFSALKHACVTQCQRPMPFFFANWSTEGRGVFRLGLRQGLYCLGCCWAMMLLMLAVGTMNVIWMVGLGVVMTIEKLATTTRFSRAIGVVCILIGAALVGTAVAAHWPTRPA